MGWRGRRAQITGLCSLICAREDSIIRSRLRERVFELGQLGKLYQVPTQTIDALKNMVALKASMRTNMRQFSIKLVIHGWILVVFTRVAFVYTS